MHPEAAPLLEFLFQQVFQDALRQDQHKGKLRRQPGELDFGAAFGAFVKRNRFNALPALDGLAGQSLLVEQLPSVRECRAQA